jgi:hypothetical protein
MGCGSTASRVRWLVCDYGEGSRLGADGSFVQCRFERMCGCEQGVCSPREDGSLSCSERSGSMARLGAG